MSDQVNGATVADDDQVAAKVMEIVSGQKMIDDADVTMASTPEDLGIDSLGQVEIVFGIEEAFDISVPYNANDPSASDFDLSTVGAIISAVKKLIDEKGAT